MAWKKANLELAAHLDKAVADFKPEKKQMFGHPVQFVNNNMFAGIFGDDIWIRLPAEYREAIFAENDEAQTFEPMRGRQMREYVVLPESIHGNPDLLDKWLNRSYHYVYSLPVKVKKPKKKKK
ncbi:TfoX/Sxy family protein [bacterium]|nr:TfoX/Sxy family protein [bacterium]MBU1650716.1 TfoX/Sxy family protein [bacterium]